MSKLTGYVSLRLIDPKANPSLQEEIELSDFGLEEGSDLIIDSDENYKYADALYKAYAENLSVEVSVYADMNESKISPTIVGTLAEYYEFSEVALIYNNSHLKNHYSE